MRGAAASVSDDDGPEPAQERIPMLGTDHRPSQVMDEEQTAFMLEVAVPEAYWPMREPVDLSGLDHTVPRTWVKLLRDRTPSPETADVFAERAGCATVVELDAGHFAMITHPRALADLLNSV